jgi:thiamine biosynthesis lipoprotein
MSYEEGKALVDSLDGVEALWIFDDGEILYTEGVEELIEQ